MTIDHNKSKEMTDALNELMELIPDHLSESFDALRQCPVHDDPGCGFFMTSVLVDDVAHWGICAYSNREEEGVTVIPIFIAIPPGHSVRLAVDPEVEAIHLTEEQWAAASAATEEDLEPRH